MSAQVVENPDGSLAVLVLGGVSPERLQAARRELEIRLDERKDERVNRMLGGMKL